MASIAVAPARQSVLNSWNALCSHLQQWFHQPDLQALSVCLAAAIAHYAEGDPVWLFVIGPAASGKTSIVINCLSEFKRSFVVGDINMRALLSHAKGCEDVSLLKQIGTSGILLFKDFTSILSKRDEDQKEFAGALREIFDGSWSRRTGQNDTPWKGKITVFAATTPVIERHWGIYRDLGERFLQVRWPNGSAKQVSRKAREQHGHEKEIADSMRSLTRSFLEAQPAICLGSNPPNLSDSDADLIDSLSASVALLRATVTRNKNTITEVGVHEEPSRIGKGLACIARSHAALFRRESIQPDDLSVALRVGLDSVPSPRARILRAIPLEGVISSADIIQMTDMLQTSFRWHAEEMEALRLIEVTRTDRGQGNSYSLQPAFRKLWSETMRIPP